MKKLSRFGQLIRYIRGIDARAAVGYNSVAEDVTRMRVGMPPDPSRTHSLATLFKGSATVVAVGSNKDARLKRGILVTTIIIPQR